VEETWFVIMLSEVRSLANSYWIRGHFLVGAMAREAQHTTPETVGDGQADTLSSPKCATLDTLRNVEFANGASDV
jgi:hypothetical protein